MTEISQFQFGYAHDRGYIYGESHVTPVAKSKEGYNLYDIKRDYRRKDTIREKNIEGQYAELQLENNKYLTQISEPKDGFFKRASYFERWIGHGDGTSEQEQGYFKRREFDVCGHHNDHICHIEMKEKKNGSFFYTSSFRKKDGEIVHRHWVVEAPDRSEAAYKRVMKELTESIKETKKIVKEAVETVNIKNVSSKTNFLKKILRF